MSKENKESSSAAYMKPCTSVTVADCSSLMAGSDSTGGGAGQGGDGGGMGNGKGTAAKKSFSFDSWSDEEDATE